MSTRNPQRKRRGGTVNSRQTQKRTRETTSTPEVSLEAEPIELVETVGDDIVDLTCESLEPVVVDLTHNDSVVIVEERRRPRRNGRRLRQDHADSCVVSSDDEELSRDKDVYVTTHTPRSTKDDGATGLRHSGTVSCPICMDGYSEIVQNGRLIVSTECGHVFCSQCLRDSLKNANTCPTCRKKINHKRYHPIYI
ncbi:E3 ubiquitin-protein ligase RNF4 [Apodemus sylvaticus]|uniref:E3 ubiquitin-protein ligase RNF4 n=1 Tax=Apodemus sylvaticus TaxID=10129 RepID=UPI0022428B11|nr:E3 ubiquitin-protein ligase RNF4 [Apodemus sylvaticus]